LPALGLEGTQEVIAAFAQQHLSALFLPRLSLPPPWPWPTRAAVLIVACGPDQHSEMTINLMSLEKIAMRKLFMFRDNNFNSDGIQAGPITIHGA
jgi:hypothetical protein